MTGSLAYPELLSLIDDRSAAFRAAVAGAPEAPGPVPGCPGWSMRDLALHLGTVQRSWASAVIAGEPGDATPPGDDLIGWLAESTRLLLAALGEAGPDAPCRTWWSASGAPQSAGAVARHQMQEAAVHAYDAQATAGAPEPIPATVAVDAVGEFVVVTLGSGGRWPHRPARIELSAVEGPSWVVDLTPDGADPFPAASGQPLAVVHASASDLLLLLYGRVPLDAARVDGDRAAVEELLTWIDTD